MANYQSDSEAHQLLLSKFLRPRDPSHFRGSEDWHAVLGEPIEATLGLFISQGLLQHSSLEARISNALTIPRLKELLGERGLARTGKKQDLISRLIQADLPAAEKTVEGFDLLQCTDIGQAVAQTYIEKKQQERSQAQTHVLEALRHRRFSDACAVVSSYEARQVFQRGINVDWHNPDPSADITRLDAIFSRTPQLLKGVPLDAMEHLRVAAAMMLLWGESDAEPYLPERLLTGLRFDNSTAARMLVFHAHHVTFMSELKRARVIRVRVIGGEDATTCPHCRALRERVYKIDEAPELPYEGCTSEAGCRCSVVGDFAQ